MFHFEEKSLSEKFLSEIPIVVLDTETTGLSPSLGDRVVEVAALRLENWRTVARFDQLVNPGRPISPEASRVNGIYDEDLVGQPTFAEIADDLLELMDGALLVAHNASFDADFLAAEFAISGHLLESDDGSCGLPNPWLCTMKLAQQRFYFPNNRLGTIARELGIHMEQAHRAQSDVNTTAAVFGHMVKELYRHGLATVGDFVRAQGGYIFARTISPSLLPPLLREALKSRSNVRIQYHGASGRTTRVITPLYCTGGYLRGYCHLRQAERTFRLDRIISVEPAPDWI